MHTQTKKTILSKYSKAYKNTGIQKALGVKGIQAKEVNFIVRIHQSLLTPLLV